MLEKLLETLVRIAVALEKIADKNPAATITEKHEHNEDGTAKKATVPRTETNKPETKPENKPETKKVEPEKAEPEVTFDQCKAAFLCLAKGLRDVHGVEKMKKITLGILNDFTGGQPLSTASLPEDQYFGFLEVVAAATAALDQPED